MFEFIKNNTFFHDLECIRHTGVQVLSFNGTESLNTNVPLTRLDPF